MYSQERNTNHFMILSHGKCNSSLCTLGDFLKGLWYFAVRFCHMMCTSSLLRSSLVIHIFFSVNHYLWASLSACPLPSSNLLLRVNLKASKLSQRINIFIIKEFCLHFKHFCNMVITISLLLLEAICHVK